MTKNSKSRFCLYKGSKAIYLALVGKPKLEKANRFLKQDKRVIVVSLHHDKHAQRFAFDNVLTSVSVCSSARLLRWVTHLITTKKKLAKRAKKKDIEVFLVERFHGKNSLF